MSAETNPNIPADIASYLDEVAERLWSNHAAVMVGAGFSKNARKAIASALGFPNWHQLGDQFYQKIHGNPPSVDQHYLNPLKLADEVQAAFGRSVLDQLLLNIIPDKAYEPSDLHISLLELPWVDVFTTNYDTLLERAADKVTTRRFDIVVSKADLVYSTRPRIIKLHGSFPSVRPFLISEEDYRRYPKEQAPFVNTVQQSLLENTLCMIGFSGDDPNFLHWIGWVKDNLGKSYSSKMYLVGVLPVTAAQRKLLEERNIVLIDMSQCSGVDGNHQKAFSLAFDYLLSRKPPAAIDWPRSTPGFALSRYESIGAITQAWKNEREAYPNWVIPPKDSRDLLAISLRQNAYGLNFLAKSDSSNPPADFSFLYELNWRLERVLCPITSELLPHYEKILALYNPYPRLHNQASARFTPGNTNLGDLRWKQIGQEWIDLHLSLLRAYREEGLTEKWDILDKLLENLRPILAPEQIARLCYERCLKALFLFDCDGIKKAVAAWPTNWAIPFGEVKRAGILAEFGETSEAFSILEEALANIRAKQQLSPVVTDFTWVSQESYAMYLLTQMELALHSQKQLKDDKERWDELNKYKCDPWEDLEIFKIRLKAPLRPTCETREKGFDINIETITHHYGGNSEDLLLGYSILRYCEDAGLPFTLTHVNIAQDQAKYAIDRIASSSPFWALITIFRVGDTKMAATLFNRESLAKKSAVEVDGIVDRYVEMYYKMRPDIAKTDFLGDNNLAARVARLIPEILSRLCVKCSSERAQKMLNLLKDLYTSEVGYHGTGKFAERLIRSLVPKTQCLLLRELIEFPILGEENPRILYDCPEPFSFLTISKQEVQALGCFNPVKTGAIELLLSVVRSGSPEKRYRASIRLIYLYDWGLLTPEQAVQFGEALWGKVGSDGFPVNARIYKSVYLTLPCPAGIDLIDRFKKYVRSHFVGGESLVCTEIVEATINGGRKGTIDWTDTEAVELLDRLLKWWNSGKGLLKVSSNHPRDSETRADSQERYNKLTLVLLRVVARRLPTANNSALKDRIRLFLKEFEEYGMYSLPIWVECIPIFPEDKERITASLYSAFVAAGSPSLPLSYEAADAFVRVSDPKETQKLFGLISQQIKWRREPWLIGAMHFMRRIMKAEPGLLSAVVTDDILWGLTELLKESSPLATDSSEDINARLLWRQYAVLLAKALATHLTDAKKPVPPVLLEWEKVLVDPEEFSEIRNPKGN